MVCYSRLLTAFFCILVLSFNAYADNDYLQMLETEAADLKLDQSGQIKSGRAEQEKQAKSTVKEKYTHANWKWNGDLEGDELPAGLAEDEFALLLEQRFYGTFVFYRKLNSNDKRTVYFHYRKAPKPDLNNIRQDILGLLKH